MMKIYGVQSHKELFKTISANYDEVKDMNVLLSEKKRHRTFGYSLNREEKERERIKSLANAQFNGLLKDLPYLSLDASAAEQLMAQSEYGSYLPAVIANAQSFGFTNTAECVSSILDNGHGISVIRQANYGELESYKQDILSTLLERGLERDILKHSSDSSIRTMAVERVISNTNVEQDIPEGQLKAGVKAELTKLFDGLGNGEKSQRVILPTLDDVTQFEQVLPAYLEALDIRSTIFTPNKQRDLEIGLKKYRPDRHGDGTAKSLFADVAIIDRSDLRAGDLLFRNMSRERPDKIVVAVATKPYETAKLLQSVDNLSLLTRPEAEALKPEEAATLYNELLAKEGMPEEFTGDTETPLSPEELEDVANDLRNDGLFR